MGDQGRLGASEMFPRYLGQLALNNHLVNDYNLKCLVFFNLQETLSSTQYNTLAASLFIIYT